MGIPAAAAAAHNNGTRRVKADRWSRRRAVSGTMAREVHVTVKCTVLHVDDWTTGQA